MTSLYRRILAVLAPPALAPAQAPGASVQTYEAAIADQKGTPIGKLTIRSSENATVVRIAIEPGGLAPGWHGVHFHSVGDCSDADRFERSRATSTTTSPSTGSSIRTGRTKEICRTSMPIRTAR